MKNKAIIALEALLRGQRFTVQGHEWILCDDNELCTVAKDQQNKEHYLKTHMTLSAFISIMNKLSDEDTFLIGAELVLKKISYGRSTEIKRQ